MWIMGLKMFTYFFANSPGKTQSAQGSRSDHTEPTGSQGAGGRPSAVRGLPGEGRTDGGGGRGSGPVSVLPGTAEVLRNWRSLEPRKRAPFYASSQVTGQTPQILEQAVSRALLHRWSAMLTHAAATAYAASLEGSDGASIGGQ